MLTNRDKSEYTDRNNGDIVNYPTPGAESAKLGYETTDVNVRGVLVFLGGLFGFVLIFFAFCFLMGRVINEALNKQDGPTNKWHQLQAVNAGGSPQGKDAKRQNLKANATMEQEELGQMAKEFPHPQLEIDDSNGSTANLHAREDLLLGYYSSTPGQPGIRIPIDRAMELVAEKGLPVAPASAMGQRLAFDQAPVIMHPLTSGFARTGYELDQIEVREQQLAYGKAAASAHAELRPVK